MTLKSLFIIPAVLLASVFFALPSSAETDNIYAKDARQKTENTVKHHADKDLQHGKATYYSKKWHGRRTSSGEKLDNYGYQCAHKTLPFGSLVKVTNKKNGKSCVVKVVDRGPYAKGMIIDLTHKAAQHIGMINDGVVQVSLEKLDPATRVADGQIIED